MLSSLALTLSKHQHQLQLTHNFFNLIFNSTLQLINGILNDHQKLLRYLNGTAGVASFGILV